MHSPQASLGAASGRDMFENDAAVYETSLESTKAIPWKIDWSTMQFTYPI